MFDKDSLVNYTISNPENINIFLEDNKISALIAEKKFFSDFNGEFVDEIGYDGIVDGKKIEVKYTRYRQNNRYFRINKCNENKEGRFDFIAVIDGLNNRTFCVPHDEWYSRGYFVGNEFHWNCSYHRLGVKKYNTQLLLDYELSKENIEKGILFNKKTIVN